jgi:hypothetical protein
MGAVVKGEEGVTVPVLESRSLTNRALTQTTLKVVKDLLLVELLKTQRLGSRRRLT